MISFSFISLLSAVVSVFVILTVLSIFQRVYEEDYKRPWIYIGGSGIFLGSSQLLRYFSNTFGLNIFDVALTQALTLLLEFVGISFLAYGLFKEYWILKYFKGRFVKTKFIPVQEGTLGGEIDLNVSKGNSYLAIKKDKKVLIDRFAEATKKGFEGFLITEQNPREIRKEFSIYKTPIAWINQLENSFNSDYLKEFLDENSDVVDPIELNNLISYVDNFLEQSMSPFILIELDFILKVNNYLIVDEFLQYVNNRIKKYEGIMICLLNSDILSNEQLSSLSRFIKNLE